MSLIIAPGRVLRCQHCGAHLEIEPDMSREHGYPMLHCPDCADEAAGLELDDADIDWNYVAVKP